MGNGGRQRVLSLSCTRYPSLALQPLLRLPLLRLMTARSRRIVSLTMVLRPQGFKSTAMDRAISIHCPTKTMVSPASAVAFLL